MFRKNYLTLLLATALFLVGSSAVFAQSGMVRGTVSLKKADGTTAPLADVLIDIYRTDIAGKLPSGKTNKKGEFTILGFVPGGRYVLAVSAPNIKSDIYPDIKAGDEKVNITVVEGDGKAFTEQQVKQFLASAPKNTPTGELTAEQKKQQAEQAQQQAKYETEKKKVDNINAVVGKSQTEGNKAFKEGNYDLAIASYDEGINADPDFEGSAPVLLTNKSAALISRAIGKYNAAVKGDPSGKAAALESIKKDLTDSVTASKRALEILKTANSTDANVQKAYATQKNSAYVNELDGYSRMFSMGVDTTKGKDSVAVFNEYAGGETDAARKTKVEVSLADGLRNAGDSENAIFVYRKALEGAPDNPDVLAGLGLSLFNSGVVGDNKEQKQEGLNLMQRFAEIAPETHPLKASVKDAVEYLKTQDKLTPQKVTKGTVKKKS